MDTHQRNTSTVYLRGYLDGRPVDASALLAAVREGRIDDFERIQLVVDGRPYLSGPAEPVPEELAGYGLVSSVILGKEPGR